MTELSADAKRELLARLLRERAEQRRGAADARGTGGAEGTSPVLRPLPRDGGELPLSFGQERVWFLEQLHPGSPVYNLLMRVGLSGPLDVEALRRSVEAVVERHEVLRATFPTVEGRPVQRISAPRPWMLPIEDLRGLPGPARDAEERRRSAAEGRAPFDLATGPMLRTTLFRLADTEHVLALAVHHIASDGWSLNLMLRELTAFYTAFASGVPAALPDLPVQYADFADWQRRWLTNDTLQAQRGYWLDRLGGTLPVLDLPADRPRPAVRTFDGAARTSPVDPRILEGLRELSRREGVTLFATLLAAFKTLLLRYTGQSDLIVGAPVAGRIRREVESLVGFFVNTLVLRTDLDGDPTFREAMRRVRDTVIGAQAHPDLPFERLVEELQPERDLTRSPLFEVLFNMLSFGFGDEIRAAGLSLRPLPSLELLSTTDGLTLYGLEARDRLELCLVYSPELFDVETVARLEGHLHALLAGIVANPDGRLSTLPLLPDDERHRLLVEWNATDVPFPLTETFARQFEAQAARTPEAIAGVDDDGALTYRELDRRADRLARRLVAAGAGRDRVVALLADRSLEFLTWILAVFKAGAAYLPLDPRHPATRHATILAGSSTALVLVSEAYVADMEAALAEMAAGARPAVLRPDATAEDAEGFERVGDPDDLAYVIYTSGSTGVPKGAMVEQVGMLNHLHAKIRDLGLTAADTVAQTASQCFDISVWQFLAPLLVGGRVRIVADEIAHDPPRLLDLVDRERVTVVEVVPSVLASAFHDDTEGQRPLPGLGDLRWLIVTGEAAPPALCRRWLDAYPRAALMNGYGPTECSDDVTHHVMTEPPPADATQVPIGRPIANMRVYVLDRALAPTPIGVPGELCVGGIGVGRGYLADPARTAEVFVADPFAERPNARLYRTGDLARWRADGTLEFLGRLDYQVKVRGFRIELGEIEAVLARHPAVREVVAVARDVRGERRLVAYVAAADEVAIGDLRGFAARALPDYMVPETVVVLPALPLTPNGKVDRRALPEPALPARPLASVLPRTPVEDVIASIWAQVLGLERVGIHENFFQLGGHSLLATRVVSRLREAFALDVPVRTMFEAPTVAGLAAYVDGMRRRAAGRPSAPLMRATGPDRLTPSFAQQRLWFFEQLEPGSAVYNVPAVLRLRGRLDVAALEASLTEIARRHEALRTTFVSEDGRPVQVIAPPSPWTVPVIDLRGLPDGERETAAERLAAEEAAEPFHLTRGPLGRVRLVRLADDLYLLLITFHHIVADGWAFDVFLRELTALYEAAVSGRPAALPSLPIQYADFAAWQREALSGEALDARLAYWKQQLAGAPAALELPVDQPRQAGQTFRGGSCLRMVEAPVLARLQALSRRENATLFMTLLAAFDVVLGRQSGQDDVCVGVPVAGRTHADTEGLIGLFVNTLVLRTRLEDRPGFRELLRRVRETALDAYAHQDVPFEKLVEALQPERDLSRTPLFQVLFNMVSFGDSATVDLPALRMEPAPLAPGWATPSKFDITLYARESAEGLGLAAVYNANLFSARRMEALLDQLVQVLAAVSDSPDADVMGVSLLTPATAPMLPDPTLALDRAWTAPVHVRFRRHAERAPARVAVVDRDRSWTYGELEERSNQLARYLRGHGIGREDRVAIHAERTAGLAWAMLGVLKAGAAFMILDPAYPPQRTLACLRGARPRGWIELAGAEAVPPVVAAELATLEDLVTVIGPAAGTGEPQAWSREPTDALETAVGPDDLAYVVFTSGSTGVPKGIAGTHGPLSHFFAWHAATADLGADDRFALLSGLAHDPLLRDVLGAFWAGATLCVPDSEQLGAPGYLVRWLATQQVSVAHLTPALATLMTGTAPSGSALPALRRVFFGGDVLTSATVAAVRRLAPAARYVNFYGASETPQAIAWYVVPDDEPTGRIPLGQGTADAQLLVLNRAGRLAGVGELGEIHVRTPYLARGYVDDARLTAERFIANPLTGDLTDRVYRTGDQGRYRPDGAVEFCGRQDDQVKIRGFRIELGEVEAALRAHAGVAEAVVVLRGEAADARLAAYVVAATETSPGADELRTFLRTLLPEYMIPARFVALARLPLTPNGKVDRRALPEDDARLDRPHVAPRTPAEARVAAIWCDVLGREAIGVDESFFELGGHSLLATRLASRVSDAFGVELPVRRIFELPTVTELADHLELVQRQGADVSVPLVPSPRIDPIELSFSQQRLWFFDQLEPGNPVYNLPVMFELAGSLDLPALETAVSTMVARHETLRTTFPAPDGHPRQQIEPPRPLTLPLVDVSALAPDAQEAELRRVTTTAARGPFDLGRGPLVRPLVLRVAADRHLLLLTFHHTVCDGWSIRVVLRELTSLYGACARGAASPLPPLAVQYADFAQWQRRRLSGEALRSQLDYWKGQLTGAPPVLELPTDRARPATGGYTAAGHIRQLSPELTAAVRALSRRHGATVFMTLLAAFKTLLFRYTGQDDLVVGAPVAGRLRTELEPLIGVFINTLVLRTSLAGDPTFREVLGRVRDVALGAYAHQEVPFDRLVEELAPERDLSRPPLVQILINMQTFEERSPSTHAGEVQIRRVPVPVLGAVEMTTLFAFEAPDCIYLSVSYRAEMYEAATMERMLAHLETLLQAAVADPEQRISALALMDESERLRVLVEWNDTAVPFALERTLAEHFEAQVARDPDAVAVVGDTEVLSYRELDARAAAVARRLTDLGVGRETVVALLAERSPELLVWILGVFKAGAAYLPLDPRHPGRRIDDIVARSGATVVLTTPEYHEVVGALTAPIKVVVSDGQWHHEPDAGPGSRETGPRDLAYVIYTSGSTGTPKGAMVEQVGMVNHLFAKIRDLGLTGEDTVAQTASQCFDISVWQFLAALLVGGRVRVVSDEVAHDGARLLELVDREGVTVLEVVPALLASAFDGDTVMGRPPLAALRWLVVTGEAVAPALCRRWLRLYPGIALMNGYGPTECSDDVTHHVIGEPADDATQVPIGRPIANTRIYVLDRAGAPVPVGVPGELHVGGVGVGRGYRNDAERTAEAFGPDPFGVAGDRVYRTGDLGRWRADGTLEFLGRLDYQVKVRGFRIELGEIEAVLARHPAVREVVVTAPEDGRGGRRLVAYVVSESEPPVTAAELRGFLADTLPEYMVPDGFMMLPALPVTPNGKVDRRALPELPTAAPGVDSGPRTPVEEITADVWADVLGLPRLGLEDNFFDLGGHSLLATRVVSRLRGAFGIELPVRALFEAPTVAALARRIERAQRGDAGSPRIPPIRPRARTGPLPLSFSQQRLWFFEQLEPGRDVYGVTLALRLRGHLDIEALERSLSTVVARHEALRTTFVSVDGEPVQVIHPPGPWTLPVVDLSERPPAERDAAAARLATEQRARPFDLAAGPLLRGQVARLDHDHHALILTTHHIVVDGWAGELLVRELAAAYAAEVTGHPLALAPLPIQYADFALWQRDWLSGETLANELAYWRHHLEGAPAALDLPLDRPRAAVQTFTGLRVVRLVDADVRDALHALSRREGATLFMTVLAVFKALLARHSGQDDVCVGVPVAGRHHAETEPLIGVFINTLVLRTRLDRRPTFRELLRRVRETALGAYAHAELPFEKLVEELQPERDLSRTPLFQVLFNMLNFGSTAPLELPGLEVELPPPSLTDVVASKFDLTLYVRDEAEGLRLTMVYNADLFAEARIEAVADQMVRLLGAVAMDADVDLARVPLVTAAAAPVLPDPTAPLAPAWTESVIARFRAHAAAAPQRPAVVAGRRVWTYGELEGLSNQLARYLIEHGVGREDRVAIFASRSAGLAWALLGVLKAGAGFMCLDPAHPPARTVACLQIAPPRAWIHLDGAGLLPPPIAQHLAALPELVAASWPPRSPATDAWMRRAKEAPGRDVAPDDLAYVAFTSGSTGAPKAIAGTHRPLAHFFAWHAATFDLGADDRFAALSGLAHDPLLRDVLGAFWVGAAVCLPEAERLATPGYLAEWLAAEQVTVAHLTPPLASMVLERAARRPTSTLPTLRRVFFGADVLTTDIVERMRALAPQAQYVNFYGATETPQAVGWYRVPDRQPGDAPSRVPLGRGVADAQLLVVSAAGDLAGIGEVGEIQVRTPYLARGYVADPGLTAERFAANPFTGAAADRVYRTGDLGRYRPDGTVEFHGRRDGQVKIRGFRVELAEVEAALRRCPGVGAAVAHVLPDAGRDGQLVAYVVAGAGESPTPEELRRHVGAELPGYMVPSIFVAVDRLPLTPNGKVDVAALPRPTPPTRGQIAPRTSTETALAQVWRDVLAVEGLGIEDNFFELGGHSLLAVRLFARIEHVFGLTLPLATLFQAPTIERQAELIDRRGHDGPWRALVPIQPSGSRPPVFAIPGLGGIVVAFNNLATLLGSEQPFYGLQPRGLDGRLPPFETIEMMAEHYLAEVRGVQPHGPYFLIGVCMGGLVAFEMAQRLRADGEEVAFLALLDVRPPQPLRRWLPAGRQRLAGAILRLVATRLAAYSRTAWQRPSRKQVREIADRVRRLFTIATAGDPLQGARGELYRQIVTTANAAAMHRYVPRRYAGSLVLVLAADRKYTRGTDRRLDWRRLVAGGVDICVVPGADSGLTLVDPNVRTLAEEFRARLERATARSVDVGD